MSLTYELDHFGTTVHLATSRRDHSNLRRRLPKHQPLPRGDRGATTILGDGKRTIVVVFIDLAAHAEDGALLDTVAHEATHAACLLLDHIGEEYDGESETLAYLVGWLTAWLFAGCRDGVAA